LTLLGDSPLWLQIKFTGGNMPRVRGLRVFAHPAAVVPVLNDGLRVDAAALSSFRSLASQVFVGLGAKPGAPAGAAGAGAAGAAAELPDGSPGLDRQGSELRQRVAGMLFDTGSEADGGKKGKSRSPLAGLQERVLDQIGADLEKCITKFVEAKAWVVEASAAAEGAGAGAAGAAGAGAAGGAAAAPPPVKKAATGGKAADGLCYELVSMLQSLSASPEGCLQVARPTLLATCVKLFPVSTPRVQRSLLQIFRRVLPLVRPDALDTLLKVPEGLLRDNLVYRFRCVEVGETGADKMVDKDEAGKPTLRSGPGATVAFLLLSLSKAIGIQVRGRAAGRAVTSTANLHDAFLPGALPATVASSFAALLRTLCEEKGKKEDAPPAPAAGAGAGGDAPAAGGAGAGAEESKDDVKAAVAPAAAPPAPAPAPKGPTWRAIIRSTLTQALSALPYQMETVMDAPAKCAFLPQLWLCLGGLLFMGEKHDSIVELARLAAAAKKIATGPTEEDHICDNHQDGRTLADVACITCAPEFAGEAATAAHFCHGCDVALHLRKTMRDHTRTPIASRIKAATESFATIDYVSGCSRFKLAWLQLAVYEQRCKAMVE